jgi:hypothetical protein
MAQAKTAGAAASKAAAPALTYVTTDEVETVDDLEERDVPVPEWGEGKGVRIKALSQKQRGDIRQRSMVRNQINDDLYALHQLVESVIVPKFTVDQVAMLKEKSARAIDRITEAINDVNGLNEAAMAALEAMFRNES